MAQEHSRSLRVASWLAAATWIALWWAAMIAVALPWRHLGGIVDERLRWLLRVALLSSLWLGYRAARWDTGPGLRVLLYPVALVASTAIAVLRLLGYEDAVGIPTTALAAWAAGVWGGRASIVRARFEDWLQRPDRRS